jgi:hypothetical protein
MTSCDFCASGSFSFASAIARGEGVSRGTSRITGASSCQNCIDFFRTDKTVFKVKAQCDLCEPGLYRHNGACHGCPEGKFQAHMGSEECTECDRSKGEYQSVKNATYCDTARSEQVIWVDDKTGAERILQCPPSGVDCLTHPGSLVYKGGWWHDPLVQVPNCSTASLPSCTNLYVCINDGCPSANATIMRCKEGYEGPLCAICRDDYFLREADCVRCNEPRWRQLLGFAVFFVAIPAAVVFFARRRFVRYLKHLTVFSRKYSRRSIAAPAL